METWTEKYRPKKLKEIAGNSKAIKALLKWVNEWKEGIPEKKAVLLYGPPGVGKTSVAYALANELGYDYIELNASDTRTYKVINRIVGAASHTLTLSNDTKRKKIIILDEVDGIHGKYDIGGLKAIVKCIKETFQPIVLIANNPWNLPKEFRQLVLMIQFGRINTRTIVKILKEICRKEGIVASENVLKIIATNSNGDLRAAINDLQALAQGEKKLTIESTEILSLRDSEVKIYETVLRILKTKYAYRAIEAVQESEEDPETIIQWLVENVPREYTSKEDLSRAFDYLSKADIYLGRIKRRQDWGLMKYAIDFMSAGVALAKEEKYSQFVKYSYPTIFTKLAQTKKIRERQKAIAEKLKQKLHCSKKVIKEIYFPLFEIIFRENEKEAIKLAREFELDLEDIIYFVGEDKIGRKIYNKAKVKARGNLSLAWS